MPKYRVCQNCSIIDASQKLHKAGELVEGSEFSPAGLKDALANGFLLKKDVPMEPDYVPGVPDHEPLSANDDDPSGIRTSVKINSPAKVPSNEPRSDVSQWTLDPVTLQGKSLDDLNVMIAERMPDADRDAFLDNNGASSTKEAIALLSKDYATSGKAAKGASA